MMFKLAPSILSADFCRLGEQLDEIKSAGAQYIHVDVMDGHFVPNLSIGVPVVESIRKRTDMIIDVHLMIDNPEMFIKPFAAAGADIIDFHVEASDDPLRVINGIKSLGKHPAMTVKPGTHIETVFPYLKELSMVLIMSVEPGFGGQALIPAALEKAKVLRNYLTMNNMDVDIEMDGGIALSNVSEVIKSGANVIVAGSAIFGASDVPVAVRKFMEIGVTKK